MPEQTPEQEEVDLKLDEDTAGLVFKIVDNGIQAFGLYGKDIDEGEHKLNNLITGIRLFLSQDLGLNYLLFLGNSVNSLPKIEIKDGEETTEEQLALLQTETKGNA